jgi:hypothetical protein
MSAGYIVEMSAWSRIGCSRPAERPISAPTVSGSMTCVGLSISDIDARRICEERERASALTLPGGSSWIVTRRTVRIHPPKSEIAVFNYKQTENARSPIKRDHLKQAQQKWERLSETDLASCGDPESDGPHRRHSRALQPFSIAGRARRDRLVPWQAILGIRSRRERPDRRNI